MMDATTDTLDIRPPIVDEQYARDLVRKLYGVDGDVRILTGERDLNFLVTQDDGMSSVFKIANAGEEPSVLDFQIAALEYLAKQDEISPLLQRVLRTSENAAMAEIHDQTGRRHYAYRLSFAPGRPFAALADQGNPKAAAQIGTRLGQLDAALASFSHPAQSRRLLWDLSLAAELRGKLEHVASQSVKQLAKSALDRFEAEYLPYLEKLPTQVIHNDLNPHNIIIDPDGGSLTGIIDFGDMVSAPRINDIAVAASYHFASGTQAPLALISAANQILALDRLELNLLPVAIATRGVLTVAITSWRAALYPENRTYIQRNLPAAVQVLTALSGYDYERFTEQVSELGRKEH